MEVNLLPTQNGVIMNRAFLLICSLTVAACFIVHEESKSVKPSRSCLQCLCVQESGCKPIGCQQKKGKTACGYFLIDLPYYTGCGKPGLQDGEEVTVAWKRCADDYGCSTLCVQNNYKNTARNCGGQKTPCEMLVRNHEGGPFGCLNNNTASIWSAVSNCCTDQCDLTVS